MKQHQGYQILLNQRQLEQLHCMRFFKKMIKYISRIENYQNLLSDHETQEIKMYLHFPESLMLGLHELRDVLLLRG